MCFISQIYRRFLELSAQYCVDFLCNCGMFLSVEFIVFTCGNYSVEFIVLPVVIMLWCTLFLPVVIMLWCLLFYLWWLFCGVYCFTCGDYAVVYIVFTCGGYAVVFIVLPAVVVVPEAGGGRVAGVSLCLMAHCIVWGACNVL